MNNNLKHKVGDKVRIIAQNKSDYHSFDIGEEVKIIHIHRESISIHDYKAISNRGRIGHIDECACEAIENPKIKGYRLKEECRKYEQAVSEIAKILPPMLFDKGSRANEHLEKAGVMHWFEPVYEEPEFTAKKGEWVVIEDFGKVVVASFSLNKAYQLSQDLEQYVFCVEKDDTGCHNGYTGRVVESIKLRMATPSEIAKAKEGETVIIKMSCKDKNGNDDSFEIEVSKKGIYYRPDDAWLNPEDLKCMVMDSIVRTQTAGKSYKFTVIRINAGCKLSTLVSDWEKVLSGYEGILKQ
jgi:hypothetical protein